MEDISIAYIDKKLIEQAAIACKEQDYNLGVYFLNKVLQKLNKFKGQSPLIDTTKSTILKELTQAKKEATFTSEALFYQQWTLSKSTFIKGMQCEKLLYLTKYKKKERTPYSKAQLAIFKKGHLFEDEYRLAQFPHGYNLQKKLGLSFGFYNQYTQKWLEQNATGALFEAGVIEDEILILIDVLEVQDSGIHVYEIKRQGSISEVIWQDLTLQYYVAQKRWGNQLQSFNVVNRKGKGKWQTTNVLNTLQDRVQHIAPKIKQLKEIIRNKKEPNISIGEHCEVPYTCDFKAYCQQQCQQLSLF